MTTNPIYDSEEPVYDCILQVDVLRTNNISEALIDGPTTHIRPTECDQQTVSETDDNSNSDHYVTDKQSCQSKLFTNSSALGTDIANIPWSTTDDSKQ